LAAGSSGSGSGAGGPVQLTSLPPEVLFLIAHHLDPVLHPPTHLPTCALTPLHEASVHCVCGRLSNATRQPPN
jgi:hypothetical protein